MLVLVTYDVNTETDAGKKRLRRVAKTCIGYGIRVQNSVFECNVDLSQFKFMKDEILNIIDKDADSIRFYHLGNHYSGKIEHYGVDHGLDQEKPIVF